MYAQMGLSIILITREIDGERILSTFGVIYIP